MRILDCSSIDSTYGSIEEILRIKRPLLEEVLGSLDLRETCRREGRGNTGEVLLDAVMKQLRVTAPAYEGTCWFHFTRTHPRNSFSRGLLPLKEALPHLWGFLLMLLPEDFPLKEWYRFAGNPPSRLYNKRLKDPASWGPFAVLSPEARLSPGRSVVHDPLAGPEVVIDICSVFSEMHGVDLLLAYRENTRPCVVPFVDNEVRPAYLGAALHYLYQHLHGGPFPSDCRVDFNGKGGTIPPERIRKVKFL